MSQSVTLRMPDVLHQRIDEEAAQGGISRSQQIIKTLEKAFLAPSERTDAPAPTSNPKPAPKPSDTPAAVDEWAQFDQLHKEMTHD